MSSSQGQSRRRSLSIIMIGDDIFTTKRPFWSLHTRASSSLSKYISCHQSPLSRCPHELVHLIISLIARPLVCDIRLQLLIFFFNIWIMMISQLNTVCPKGWPLNSALGLQEKFKYSGINNTRFGSSRRAKVEYDGDPFSFRPSSIEGRIN